MAEDPIVEIFSGSLWEAELLKSLLNDQEIECFLKNSTLNSYMYEPTYSTGVKVMILQSDLENASAIVKEFLKNNSPI
jgi:hypothetical protein